MRNISFWITVMFLAGCATTPQTRQDFEAWTRKHTTLGFSDTHTANRPFEDVVTSLRKNWDQCYNVNVTATRTQGGMTTSRYRDTFHPRFHKVSNSLAELTLQMTTQGMVMLNKIPEGGEYRIALDVQRVSQNKTKLTWHSVGHWKDDWELNKKWSDGKNAPCP